MKPARHFHTVKIALKHGVHGGQLLNTHLNSFLYSCIVECITNIILRTSNLSRPNFLFSWLRLAPRRGRGRHSRDYYSPFKSNFWQCCGTALAKPNLESYYTSRVTHETLWRPQLRITQSPCNSPLLTWNIKAARNTYREPTASSSHDHIFTHYGPGSRTRVNLC
jgi:hypothetical protein